MKTRSLNYIKNVQPTIENSLKWNNSLIYSNLTLSKHELPLLQNNLQPFDSLSEVFPYKTKQPHLRLPQTLTDPYPAMMWTRNVRLATSI